MSQGGVAIITNVSCVVYRLVALMLNTSIVEDDIPPIWIKIIVVIRHGDKFVLHDKDFLR